MTFRNDSGGIFTTLPQQIASMRFSAQSIADNTLTTPTGQASSDNTASWEYGFYNDPTLARIYTEGNPGSSGNMILHITAWWKWDAVASGLFTLTWNTDDGGALTDNRLSLGASINTIHHLSHVRRVTVASSYHYIQVLQTSGAPLNGDGLLVVTRIR